VVCVVVLHEEVEVRVGGLQPREDVLQFDDTVQIPAVILLWVGNEVGEDIKS